MIHFLINFKNEPDIVLGNNFGNRDNLNIIRISKDDNYCINCNGDGCRTCLLHGISEFTSIEGIISKYIFKKFGGTTTKFTWIGGEDKSSLVFGAGRPFFVKLNLAYFKHFAKDRTDFY